MLPERYLPRRLRERFTIIALVCAALIFLCIAPLTVWQGRELLLHRRLHDLQSRLDAVVSKGYAELRAVSQQTLAMTDIVQQWESRELESWYALMEAALIRLPNACGVRFAFEPANALGPKGGRVLYVRRGVAEGEIVRVSLSYAPDDPTSPGAKWYIPPRDCPLDLIDGHWSDPFNAPETGLEPVITCSMPIMREEDGKSVVDGVAAVDVTAEAILRELVELDIGTDYQLLVLDRECRVMAATHGGGSDGMDATRLLRDFIRSNPDAMKSFQQLHDPDQRSGWFVAKNPYSGVSSRFLFNRFPHNPTLLVHVVSERDLNIDVWWLVATVCLLGLIGMGAMGLLIRWSAGLVTLNLDILRHGVGNVQAGNLCEKLPPSSTHDETADIIDAFNDMVGELVQAFLRTEEMARKQQQLKTELDLAQTIQHSVLPGTMRPLGGSLFSLSIPAQEVGGDFFDHFVLPGGRTAFAVGDVSGKGISAAMFMMRVTLLLRSAVMGMELQDAVAQVNSMLVESNPKMMFVTLFVAVWDPLSESLLCMNAGHNPPLLLRADGSVEHLSERSGPALGALRGRQYTVWQTPFRKGDLLAVYSDGISEAPNSMGVQFGTDRMRDFLVQNLKHPLHRCASDLVDQVVGWQSGGERFDDITLSLVRAEESSRSMCLPASVDTIEQVVQLVDSHAREGGMDSASAREMSLAACEAVTNVILHSLHEDASQTYCVFTSWSGDDFVVRIEDPGPPFDPSALPHVNVKGALEDRPIGGLGWFIIRQSTEEVRMDRVSETNILTLVRSRNRPTIGQHTKDVKP